MSRAVPRPGDVWTSRDPSGTIRDTLIVKRQTDGYVNILTLHSFVKNPNTNILVTTTRGERCVDPRKLSFIHTTSLNDFVCTIPEERLSYILRQSVKLIGLPHGDTTELEQQLSCTMKSVDSMSQKIKELSTERDLYKRLVECALANQRPVDAAEAVSDKPKQRTTAEIKADNRKKYLPKQAYIGIKLKKYGITQTAIGKMLGYAGNTIAGWIKGEAPARWELLEHHFPGIEKEAEEWAEQQL